jgi:hypothetical protein
MNFVDGRRLGRFAAVAACAGSVIIAAGLGRANAADVQALVTQAVHNTDTVNTLVHHDLSTIVSGKTSLKASITGAEDEVANREQDSETVRVTGPGLNGSTQTIHYTLEVIFIKGYTFYRSSQQNNQWKQQKGTTLKDPFTGGFSRGRTTVTPPSGFKVGTYSLVGTSGGQTHVRATLTAKGEAGTFELWISSGATPYVVREAVHVHTTGGSTKGTESFTSKLGPFNKPVTIQPPITAGGTT